jgi:hypothetical protein
LPPSAPQKGKKFKNPAEGFAAQQILPVTYKEISARGVFSTFSAKDK